MRKDLRDLKLANLASLKIAQRHSLTVACGLESCSR